MLVQSRKCILQLHQTVVHESKDEESESEVSYKLVTGACRKAGAVVSNQVHKKVQCVLCTVEAVVQATQRVRKAKKKSIPLVNVNWLHECIREGHRLDFEPYVLLYPSDGDRGRCTNRDKKEGLRENEEDYNIVVNGRDISETGWSSPKELGCCCVCHETGDEKNCSWCVDCKT
jgi:hypothetical protein